MGEVQNKIKINNSNMTEKPEIEQLMRCVEQRYGHVLNTTTDFEVFSLHLKRKKGLDLSTSTLKRLWGYVGGDHKPRQGTLDVLAQYVGHGSFTDFIKWLREQCPDNSCYVDIEQIVSSELTQGDVVRIGWSPDRQLMLTYLGDGFYEVIEAHNSKIIVGDRFEAGCFVKHQQLLLPYIMRHGQKTPPFVAGRDGGLTVLVKG